MHKIGGSLDRQFVGGLLIADKLEHKVQYTSYLVEYIILIFKMRSVPTSPLQVFIKGPDGVLPEIILGCQPLSVILALR